jgi:hypothetical protein
MNVLILAKDSNRLVDAIIRRGDLKELPTISDGWLFNFQKLASKTGKQPYVLVREESMDQIEGCMVFSMHESFGPYMDLLEVCPRNKGEHGLFKNVAACLIAFACGLSFEFGKNEDKGILTFEAYSKTKEGIVKLIELYRQKYGAISNPFGYLEIHPQQAKILMDKYLYNPKNPAHEK